MPSSFEPELFAPFYIWSNWNRKVVCPTSQQKEHVKWGTKSQPTETSSWILVQSKKDYVFQGFALAEGCMQCCWELFEKCFCLLEVFLSVKSWQWAVRFGWSFVVVGYIVLLCASCCVHVRYVVWILYMFYVKQKYGIYPLCLEREISLSGVWKCTFFLCEPEVINLSTLLQLFYKWWLFDLWCWDPTDEGGNGSCVCLSLHQRTRSGRVVDLIRITVYRCGYVLSASLLCTTAFLEAWETYFPKQLGLQRARSLLCQILQISSCQN